MCTMDKDGFEKFLDASWRAFRKQLLEAYPDQSNASPLDVQLKLAELEKHLQEARASKTEQLFPET